MTSNSLSNIITPKDTKARYALAKASNRILARVIDSAIALVVAVGLALLIIATDKSGISHPMELQQTWRYLVMAIESTVVFIISFLIVPYFSKGHTLGLFSLKLQIYNLIPTKNFFINLLKREFFIWMIVVVTNLILGIVLCSMNQSSATDFLKSLSMNQNNTTSKETATIAIFHSLYAIGFLSLIFVIIHMCIYNKRRSFIDHVSDTVVIKLIDVSSSDSNKSANAIPGKRHRNYGLPGEIIASAEKEIDSL